MASITHDAPGVFPDGYPDEAPETNLDYGWEPTDADWAEYAAWSETAGERDRAWWADQQDTRDARAAAEDAVDRADREAAELAELERHLRSRRRDVEDARGGWGGHMAEGVGRETVRDPAERLGRL